MTAAPQAPETLDLNQPGNVAVLISHTFGYFPTGSVVLIGLADGHSGGHLRLDLAPVLEAPFLVPVKFAPMLTESAEHIGVHFLTEHDPDPTTAGTYRAAYEVIAEGLAAAGIETAPSFQIGPTYGRLIDCDDDCCPYPGRPAVPTGPGVTLTPENPATPEQQFEEFTSTAVYASETFTAEVEDYCTDTTSFEGMEAVAALADGTDTRISAVTVAGILANLNNHNQTAALLALAFIGPDAVETAYDTGEVPDTYGQAPDWARVERVTDALAAAAPHATAAQKANLHAVMGFIRHAQGRNSTANLHTGHAATLDPKNTMAELVGLIAHGISGWAKRKEDSYSYFKA